MKNSDVKKRWINRPFVKGFLAGIVVMAACNLSQPFYEQFEPTADSSMLTLIPYVGIPLLILLLFGWLANWTLGRFGFEGFKVSEEWQATALPGCMAGGFVYAIVSVIIFVFIRILSGTF